MSKDADIPRHHSEQSVVIQGLVCGVTTNDDVNCFVAIRKDVTIQRDNADCHASLAVFARRELASE